MRLHAKIAICVIALGFCLCTGCTTNKRCDETQSAHICELSANYKAGVMNYMSGFLPDPYSALYQFGTPRKGCAIIDGKSVSGWIIPAKINCKDAGEIYTGWKNCFFLVFKGDDGIVKIASVAEQGIKYLD